MYVLDTNVISELRKVGDGRADPHVAKWIAAQDAGALYISALTVIELEIGVLRVEERDPRKGARLRSWLDERVTPEFADRTLAVDSEVVRRCAGLYVHDPRTERDALIAATALVHGMRVVTRNVRDFEATKVTVINPWAHDI